MLQKSVRALVLPLLLAVPIACDSGTDPVVPASVDLQAEVDMILEGQSTQLLTTVLDESGDPITDPDLTFTSSNDAIATVDDDGLVTGVGNGEVEITATAGAESDVVGLFIFDPGTDPCQSGLMVSPGVPVRSTLEGGDCDDIIDDGSFVDLWFFDLDARTSVTIEMTSDDLDSYLFLEDDQLNLLAQDDDSAGDLDAEIEITLEAGRYWILANQVPPETGAQPEGVYTLTLTTASAAATAASLRAPDARAWRQVPRSDTHRTRVR